MKIAMTEIENKVDQLFLVLDRDIQYIWGNLSTLNEMRDLVASRDDVSLHKLLESVKSKSTNYKENETKRQSLRKELAVALDCSIEQMTLTRLQSELSGQIKDEVTRRKIKLQTLSDQLKKEHLSTTMLLADCSRFNSMMLNGILKCGQSETATYGPNGSAQRQTNSAFVNFQL